MLENTDEKKIRIWTLFTQWKRISAHSYGYDDFFFFCINTFTFIVPCAQIQFKGPSREIGGLLRNRLSKVSLKLDISNVKAERKKNFFFKVSIVSLRLIVSLFRNPVAETYG